MAHTGMAHVHVRTQTHKSGRCRLDRRFGHRLQPSASHLQQPRKDRVTEGDMPPPAILACQRSDHIAERCGRRALAGACHHMRRSGARVVTLVVMTPVAHSACGHGRGGEWRR